MRANRSRKVKPLVTVVHGFPLDRYLNEEGQWEDLTLPLDLGKEEKLLRVMHREGIVHPTSGQVRRRVALLYAGAALAWLEPSGKVSQWDGPIYASGPIRSDPRTLEATRELWFTRIRASFGPNGIFSGLPEVYDVLRKGYENAQWGTHLLVYFGRILSPPRSIWDEEQFWADFLTREAGGASGSASEDAKQTALEPPTPDPPIAE